MQISLGLTCFQFAFALVLLSSHTRFDLCGSSRWGADVTEKHCKDTTKIQYLQIFASSNFSRMRFEA